MTVYISKYALTTGIYSVEVEGTHTPDMVRAVGARYPTHYHKGQWHETIEEATKKANQMRTRKIASIKKQLAKLETLTF